MYYTNKINVFSINIKINIKPTNFTHKNHIQIKTKFRCLTEKVFPNKLRTKMQQMRKRDKMRRN